MMTKFNRNILTWFMPLILIFIVGCGVKGPLYQTPAAAETTVNSKTEQNNNHSQQNNNTSENIVKQENK